MRHSTPDLTMNTYGRGRDDRMKEISEAIGESLREETGHTKDTRQIVGDVTTCRVESYVVEDRGLEPLTFWLPAKRSSS